MGVGFGRLNVDGCARSVVVVFFRAGVRSFSGRASGGWKWSRLWEVRSVCYPSPRAEPKTIDQ